MTMSVNTHSWVDYEGLWTVTSYSSFLLSTEVFYSVRFKAINMDFKSHWSHTIWGEIIKLWSDNLVQLIIISQ